MKLAIIAIVKRFLQVFYIFPIKSNRVFFSSYFGKSYSCNPKYICEWILSNFDKEFDIIWAFANSTSVQGLDKRIRVVRYKSLRYLYCLLTAKVIIDNVDMWSILPKRKGQFVIHTWHGGGAYKGVGLARLDSTKERDCIMQSLNSRISLFVSSSKFFTQHTLRDSFNYKGEIIECGMPRNDILIRQPPLLAQQIRTKLGLSDELKIALIAPTFRADRSFVFQFDAVSVKRALTQRFGGHWKLLFRTHYYTTRDYEDQNSSDISNVSEYPDMQELLLISDALITDYSSSIWDYTFLKRPGFLYTPDLDYYQHERVFYTSIDTWPFPYCTTMDGLIDQILNFDSTVTDNLINLHHQELGCCESGKASEILGEIVCNQCGVGQKGIKNV